MEEVVSFVFAAVALAGSPGPNTLSLAAVSAVFGARSGIRYGAGLIAGVLAVVAIVGSGVVGLLMAAPGAAPIITAVAAAYFIYLAYRIATAPPLTETSDPSAAPKWWEGTLLSLVNPKAYAAMAALFSGFTLVASGQLADAFAKTALVFATLVVVNACWILAGTSLTVLLRDPHASRTINVGFAVLLLVSVAAALLL